MAERLLRRNPKNKNIVITLDGPAASGKSTTARLVAARLGWLYLDTGAMYRAMAVKVIRQGISLDDVASIGSVARKTLMRMVQDDSGMRIFVDNEDVTAEIRTPEIDKAVGPVCEVPAVRDAMVRLQREIRQYGHLVTDGRDMGTVVFPDADLKFYVTASIEIRAKRRLIDMKNQGIKASITQLEKEIQRRDERDSKRDHSPLRPAGDAIHMDTSGMTIDEQVELILQKTDTLLKQVPPARVMKNSFYCFFKINLPKLFKAFWGFHITGTEHVPMTGGLLVAPNHVSMMDPPIVGTACPRELFFFAKQELFNVPLLSLFIRNLNAFPVRREEADRSAIRSAFQVLNRKDALLLFPEGTRSKTGEIQSAKSGIGMIAMRNQVDIVPVSIQGTYQSWRHLFQRRVRVNFGKPIRIAPFLASPLPKKEIYQKIGELTLKSIKELQDDYHN